MAIPTLLTPKETAEILGLSVTTLAIRRCAGTWDLPYVKVGRLVRYTREAVEQFIRDNTVGKEADGDPSD